VGRIKTKPVKRRTEEIMERYGDKFKTDFTENKGILGPLIETKSKKIKNTIAGYITRLVKKQKQQE